MMKPIPVIRATIAIINCIFISKFLWTFFVICLETFYAACANIKIAKGAINIVFGNDFL